VDGCEILRQLWKKSCTTKKMVESQEWDVYHLSTGDFAPPKSTKSFAVLRGSFETGLGAWRHPEIRLSIEDLHLQRDPATGSNVMGESEWQA